MNNLEKIIINDYKKSIIYKLIIPYIGLGIFIFSVNRFEYNFFELLNYVSCNPFIIIAFLIPSILSSIIYIEKKYFNNYNILIRLSKKEIIKSNLKLIFYIVSNIFIILLILSIIFTIIFSNRNFNITNNYIYNIPNTIILFIDLFKIYLFSIILGILTSYLTNKKTYIITTITVIIIISFIDILPNYILIFLPGYYISRLTEFSSITTNIIYSSLYIIINFILVFSIYLLKWKKDILFERSN